MNYDQGCLLPADIRSWLPPGHLAWQVISVTGQLDLSGFAAAYRADGQGQAPYDPAMMVALLFYCYFKGIRSSRKISAACIDDVGCRVICGGAAPSHRAVAEFIRRHRAEIKRLFVQVLSLLAAEGAVAGYLAAVDGSPVSGNASRFANLDAGQLADRIAAVEAAIGAEAEAWLAGIAGGGQQLPLGDGEEEGEGDPPPGGAAVPRRLAALAARLARLRAAQDKLAERQAAPGAPAARIAAAQDAVDAAARRLEQAEAAQAAKMDAWAGAVAAGKAWRYGKKPVPPEQAARVARVRRTWPPRRGGWPRPGGRRGQPGQGLGHRPGLPAAARQERRLPARLEPAAGRRPAADPARRRTARQSRRRRRPGADDHHRRRQLRAGRPGRAHPRLAG